ncbi:hypothetical protein H7J77_04715 [Mycolicibacillus parakoreensis]|uniref:Uncharacterized protein n=1 Tax=Mycolicibacillus parakoreensis TaxID=1069221 RepID=A0ABY3U1I8_9MYCO|nr:hypothetical protein [Mycolicibacillus parakoreensis]MCV7314839.1 hypothetical protein [Mycolicibacillus parakoreensis]ULN53835.1 hypothetical protein MIU77_05940 [Mycolicibacillus parakoreensis]
MPTAADGEAARRTRAFARVIGPFLAVVTAVVAVRASTLSGQLAGFAGDPMWPWVLGALLFGFGLGIVAFHQYWRSLAAVLISLFGWFLLLRGLGLLVAPGLITEAAQSASDTAVGAVRAGFGLLAVCGLYLSYVGWVRQRD